MTAVSIVIPTRNRKLYLTEAIASVREQIYSDWELIVVDDGSSDETQAFLSALNDPRIRTLRRETAGGAAVARNAGLETARGELVMFLDDDDLLRDNALETLVGALRSHPEAIAAVGACRLFRENDHSTKVYHPAREYTGLIWREFLFGWWSNSGQNLYRIASVREIGGFDAALLHAEDRKMWLELALRGQVCVLPFVAMEYRQHAGQVSKRPNIEPVRQTIWREFIAALPASQQREARAIRRAAELVAEAEQLRAEGRFGAALRAQVAACRLAPALVKSPLTARPLWWGLKKCLQRSSAP